MTLSRWKAIPSWRSGGATATYRRRRRRLQKRQRALRERLADGPIQQRIVVTAGRLIVQALELAGERRLLLLSGQPVRALAKVSNCLPGEVSLPAGVVPLAAEPVATPEPDGLGPLLTPFLPRPVVDRISGGHGRWPAEFRDLTAIMIRLPGIEAETERGRPLAAAVEAVDSAFQGVGIGVAEVSEGDKGTLLRVAVGMPPHVLDDNALGAVEAARRAVEALDRIGVAAGVGLATGRAFAMEVGHERRRIHTILGPAMNRAARLMEMAKGEVLVCEATAAAAANRFDFGEPTAVYFKGETAPTQVRRLLGRRASRPAGVAGVELFGRSAEAGRLAELFDRPLASQGTLAVIEGEPGGGKSRLLTHAETLARQRGYVVFLASAQSIEQETTYFVFRQVLAQLLGGEPGQEQAPPGSEQRLIALFDGDPLLQRAEALTELLPLDPAVLGGTERPTGAGRRTAIGDILTLLLRRSGSRAVLILDDAHWLDRSSAGLLTTLLPRLPGLIVVAATRPLYADASPELRALLRAGSLQMSLGRLDRVAIEQLVRANLGGAAATSRFVDHVVARSEGLPLHAEQLVLAMQDQGLVIRSADGRRVDVNLSGHVDVVTLRDVILKRFDLLPPSQQSLLKSASVLGRNFDPALLPALLPNTPGAWRLQTELEALAGAGLLERGPRGWAFRHIRIQEAVYELLPFAQRRTLHRAAAMAIESIQGPDPAAFYAQLAAHWENAAEPAKAAAYRLRAAARALDTFAHHEAIAHLSAIERTGGNEALLTGPADQAEFARMWGRAAQELTDFEAARPWLLRCAALGGVTVRQGRASLAVGIAKGIFTQMLLRARVLRPRAPGRAAERDALSAHLHNRFAEHAYFDGDSLRLLNDTLVALNCGERGDNRRDLGVATGAVSIGLGVAGMLSLARYYQRRAIAIAEPMEPWDLAIAKMQSAVVATDLGDWPLMQSMASAGADLFARIGEQDRFATCQALLAYALIAMGDVARAHQGLTEFGEFAERVNQPRVSGWVLTARALIDLMTGQSPRRALERLNAVSKDHLAPGERTLVTGLKAGAALAAGDRSEASALAEACLGHMREARPIGLAYHGATAMTAVCLALAEAAPDDAAARQRAGEAVRQMHRLARSSVVWQGFSFWLSGREAALHGHQAKAAAFYRRGLALSERLGVPFEAALCRRALGDAKGAAATLERMGCVPWLEFGGELKT